MIPQGSLEMKKSIIVQNDVGNHVGEFIKTIEDHWARLVGTSSKSPTNSFDSVIDNLFLYGIDKFIVCNLTSTDKADILTFTFNFDLFYR